MLSTGEKNRKKQAQALKPLGFSSDHQAWFLSNAILQLLV